MSDNAETSERTLGDPIVVTDGVKKWFGDFQALKGVTATIREREVVVVIGPSGSCRIATAPIARRTGQTPRTCRTF